MTLDTRDDRTLFFDLLPLFFRTSKLSFRVKVYTVPGQPLHEATRRVVLRGADGVMFVADSQRAGVRANNESYDDLVRNLTAEGIDNDKVPIVVQYNKRDLPDVLTDAEVAALGDAKGERIYNVSAIRGEGVFEAFFGLLDQTWVALDRQVGIERGFGISRTEFMDSMNEHMGVTHSGRVRVVEAPRE
jgi:hypothetical protein